MRRRLPPPWALTALLALVYVLWTPATGDFAAQAYRTTLAERGVWLWDAGWFGGHHLPSYSVLFPALGALVGTAAAGGVAATASTWAFTGLVRAQRPGPGAEAGAWWFAVGGAAMLTTGRLTFQLGVAFGLLALWLAAPARDAGDPGPLAVAADRPSPEPPPVSRIRVAAALLAAALTPLASPVAALFLALAGVVWCLHRRTVRGLPAAVTVVPVAVAVLLTVAFPNGGSQPFAAWEALLAIGALAAAAAVLPGEERALRIGTVLYLVAIALSAVLTTPMGSNAPRLGTLLAGPVLVAVVVGRRRGAPAPGSDGGPPERTSSPDGPPGSTRAATSGRRRAALIAALGLLLVWQLYSPVQQTLRAADDDTTARSFYAPLRAELLPRLRAEPARVEVPPTARRGEARWLAPDVPLARGWIRQLDGERNALFYRDGSLDPRVYRAWLEDNAVTWVALPDAPADVRSKAERALLRSGRVPGLRRVWADAHWTLWRVVDGRPLASWADEGGGPRPRVTAEGPDSFVLEVPRAGVVDLRIRWSPYLHVSSGNACLRRSPGDWTHVRAPARGTVHVGVTISTPWRTAAPADCPA
ncbi:hypothetical protein [Patulibacter minatonensis]|uniref:hypothetical protein n=1 Tax=Patulibacter minatonensis TaxID=298163 RepID=UPI00055D3ACB|nr:hypothetical protein [Patulibacter minatonensis]